MPELDGWLESPTFALSGAASRAASEWRRILDRPSSIVISRGQGTRARTLAAQTVRLESDDTSSVRQSQAENMVVGVQHVTVFGIRDHATRADTDIERSDRFFIDGVTYEVISIMTPPGEVQAICEAVRAS